MTLKCPICSPNYLEFGGNTTCIAFQRHSNNRIGILDAGTGIRALGKYINKELPEQEEIAITFSHFHWDHIQGFPFFDPAYNPNRTINIGALDHGGKFTDLRKIFKNQMLEEYFPVQLEDMGAQFNFNFYDELVFGVEGVILKTILQNHPGGSYGFRLEADGRVIVICTDLEHGDTINEDIVEFARDADLLLGRLRGWHPGTLRVRPRHHPCRRGHGMWTSDRQVVGTIANVFVGFAAIRCRSPAPCR